MTAHEPLPPALTPGAFRAARERLGITQEALAAVLGVTPDTVYRYEAPKDRPHARQAPAPVVRIMGWLETGWRPPEWPQGHVQGRLDGGAPERPEAGS